MVVQVSSPLIIVRTFTDFGRLQLSRRVFPRERQDHLDLGTVCTDLESLLVGELDECPLVRA